MTVRRLDTGPLLREPQLLPNGWLRVDGFLTRTGVFTYRMPDGTARREYRPHEEVLSQDSLSTFELVPVTDDHPDEFLTAENTARYQRGAVSAPKQDGERVSGTFLITDAALIAKMQAGKREVSCGYLCDLEETPGVTPTGEAYDAIQRNIRGNHVAIVERGRAGAAVRVRMDAAGPDDAVGDNRSTGGNDPTTTNPAPGAKDNRMKIRIDGVDYDPSTEAFAQALQKRDERTATEVAELKKSLTESIAKADKAEARADAANEALRKAQADLQELPAKVRADMAARAELDAKARAVLGKEAKLDALTPADVRRLVLSKLEPELKLDGKSEAYVEARFDAAIESFEKDDSEWKNDADKLDTTNTTSEVKLDADKAKADFIRASQGAWKKPLTSAKSV
ncbi:MAG: DUF2213 domain-containing protein [Myxococcota bacterium]